MLLKSHAMLNPTTSGPLKKWMFHLARDAISAECFMTSHVLYRGSNAEHSNDYSCKIETQLEIHVGQDDQVDVSA